MPAHLFREAHFAPLSGLTQKPKSSGIADQSRPIRQVLIKAEEFRVARSGLCKLARARRDELTNARSLGLLLSPLVAPKEAILGNTRGGREIEGAVSDFD